MVSSLTIRIHIKKVCLGNHGTITLFVVSLNVFGYNINNELPVNFFCWSWDLSHRDYLYRDEKPVDTCVQQSDQYLSFLLKRHQAVFFLFKLFLLINRESKLYNIHIFGNWFIFRDDLHTITEKLLNTN